MLKRVEVSRFVVRCSRLPAAIENANPFKRQGAHRRLMRASFVALLSIVGTGPEGARDRGRCPFDKGLSQERGTLHAPVHPALLAAAFGHRCNARVLL